MGVELFLPETPTVLGPTPAGPARPKTPWSVRVRDALSSYLPLLLMLMLALATWWLVKNSPGPPDRAGEAPPRLDPDYTMTDFALERFDAEGRLKLRVEGTQLRHFPATDRIEIDGVQLRAVAPDGRVTVGAARQALANGDGSEVQLMGGAKVTSEDAHGARVMMQGEFLHVFLVTERLTSHLPVLVQQGGSEVRASSLVYDHVARRIELGGPMRMTMPPRASRP